MSLKTEREYHLLKEDKNPYITRTGLELLVIEKDFGQKRHSLSEERDCILKSFQRFRGLEELDREYLLESIYHYDFQNLCASFRERALAVYDTTQYSLDSYVAEFLAEEKKFKNIAASTNDLKVLKAQRVKVDSPVSSYIQFCNKTENNILEEIALKMRGEKQCFRYPSEENKLFFYSKKIREREAILLAFQEIQDIYSKGDKNKWKNLKNLIKAPLFSGEQFNLSTLVQRSKRVQFYEGVILCEELEKEMYKTIENKGKHTFSRAVIQEVKAVQIPEGTKRAPPSVKREEPIRVDILKERPKIVLPPLKREEILKAEVLKERPKIVPVRTPERALHTEVQKKLKDKAPEPQIPAMDIDKFNERLERRVLEIATLYTVSLPQDQQGRIQEDFKKRVGKMFLEVSNEYTQFIDKLSIYASSFPKDQQERIQNLYKEKWEEEIQKEMVDNPNALPKDQQRRFLELYTEHTEKGEKGILKLLDVYRVLFSEMSEQPAEYPAWYLKAVIDGKTSASTYLEKMTAIDNYLPKICLISPKEYGDFALFAKQFTGSAYSDFQSYIPQETLEKTRRSIEQLLSL